MVDEEESMVCTLISKISERSKCATFGDWSS